MLVETIDLIEIVKSSNKKTVELHDAIVGVLRDLLYETSSLRTRLRYQSKRERLLGFVNTLLSVLHTDIDLSICLYRGKTELQLEAVRTNVATLKEHFRSTLEGATNVEKETTSTRYCHPQWLGY